MKRKVGTVGTRRGAQRILLVVIALAVMLRPATAVRATSVYGSIVIGTVTFDVGTNGCLGPVVGVYGSEELKNYILTTAEDYCDYQLANGMPPQGATDVEWVAAGPCQGMNFATDFSDDNEIGATDLFPGGCTGGFAPDPSLVRDTQLGVNVVESITYCGSTVTTPQGGDPRSSQLVPCQGAAPGGASGCASPIPAQTFPFPNDISVLASQNLWNTASAQAPTDMGQLNGCPGFTPNVQLRVPGSGTRATWCFNLYGPGVDQCLGNATAPNQGTSGSLIQHLCGNPYTTPATAPDDIVGTIGYASRATVLLDPNNPQFGYGTPSTLSPIQDCGIVRLSGNDGWNRTCDPTTVNSSSPYSGFNSDGMPTCRGDLQLVAGNYPVWGYLHLDLNPAATASGANAEAQNYIHFLATNSDEAQAVLASGFLRPCQMQIARTVDGGPYSLTAGATC